ncbi:MAG: AAA family ATPase [Candidatus Diapherotrites archaeon]|nr:AAA family ATPase [Candidatus Diapherotrites archaeon]
MIIERKTEVEAINYPKKWVLVFGRRKTGKTFLVQNFVRFDEYFFVKSTGGILAKNNDSISYETFLQLFRASLEDEKTVVVDEFHRLGQDFFDFVHFMKKNGKLVIISSTLFLSKKLLSSKSALLGFFSEARIGLISIADCLNALDKFGFEKKELLELAVLMQEPIAIDYFKPKESARASLAKTLLGSLNSIPALIGEIFFEEQRNISEVYEGILRAIASGKTVSGEISSNLFAKKLIEKDDPSILQQYLNNLVSFGIIRKIKIFNKNRFSYRLYSPLSRIYYYSDEKYNFSERKLSEKELLGIIGELMPKIIEDAVRETLAEKFGLIETIFEEKDLEIDGLLLKFQKPEIALEVKWKSLKEKDIKQIEEKLEKIQAPKKILFVPDKTKIKTKLQTMDPKDLI